MSKLSGFLVFCVTAVLGPPLLLLLLACWFHREAIDSIYKNVEDISDAAEMPATITSYPSSPEVVSIIGGSGEGLNCSLPKLINGFFDNGANGRGPLLVLQRFRQACVFHDLCYRHGLATYGYNQNDCDRILQNAAIRLCAASNPKDGGSRCQTESKMVLAGVSLGGANAYRAWDRSTYFEFDPDPSRSNKFSVARVVDHPFKHVEPEKYRNDPDQVILTFQNVRSNLTVTCITCKELPFYRQTNDRYDVSTELQSVGIKRLPEALLRHGDHKLSETAAVWLPPRRRHAAPHLLVDSAGKNHLIWMTRNNPDDTVSCIVIADAGKLLTYTLPDLDRCSWEADSQLTMVEVDMLATSPLPMEIPSSNSKDTIFTTAISAKSSERNLSFCARSASRNVDKTTEDDDKANCVHFADPEISERAGLGAFQNFAIVRPGQQVLFARDMWLTKAPLWTRLFQSALGVTYSPDGLMLLIDVAASGQENGPPIATIRKKVRFSIDDRFDPMMPITRQQNDLRFLSLETTEKNVGVRITDFSQEQPTVGNVSLTIDGSEVNLHPSWALRPALVLETRDPNPRTRLVFSRGEIAVDPTRPVNIDPEPEDSSLPFDRTEPRTESVSLEMLIFERKASAASNAPFEKTSGAACMVKYIFRRHEEFPCYRAFDSRRTMRSSPAARMQASQLLIGHFVGPDGNDIAFPEACESGPPIILNQKDGAFVSENNSFGQAGTFTRQVTCNQLNSSEDIGGPIKSNPDTTISAADWPYDPPNKFSPPAARP